MPPKAKETAAFMVSTHRYMFDGNALIAKLSRAKAAGELMAYTLRSKTPPSNAKSP
jgi:hypothetical protein